MNKSFMIKLVMNGFIGKVSFNTVDGGGGELYLRDDGTFWGDANGEVVSKKFIGLAPVSKKYMKDNGYQLVEVVSKF